MTITNVTDNASFVFDNKGLSSLKAGAANGDKEALEKTARQFESMFIHMMLKNMRSSNTISHDMYDTKTIEFYQGMQDEQTALEMSKGKGIGIASMLIRQLTTPAIPNSPSNMGALVSQPSNEANVSPASDVNTFDSPESFIANLKPYAEQAAAQLGTDPKVILAQAALETGWGQSISGAGKSSTSNNLFGIKASSAWQGKQLTQATQEFRGGQFHTEQANFRAYDSIESAFNDYVDFIKSNPRYKNALNSNGSGFEYAKSLQKAGYATDPNYATKIQRVIQSPVFSKAWLHAENSHDNNSLTTSRSGA